MPIQLNSRVSVSTHVYRIRSAQLHHMKYPAHFANGKKTYDARPRTKTFGTIEHSLVIVTESQLLDSFDSDPQVLFFLYRKTPSPR